MQAFMAAIVTLYCAVASAEEGVPDKTAPQVVTKPLGDSKPVTTTIIKRCPDGYELVTRANGRHGCAKDIMPTND